MENTLRMHAFPVIGVKHVRDISTDDVMSILRPIWSTRTETATRVRSRIGLGMSFAIASKQREAANPAL
jgi:hypothetical protein